MEAVFADTIDYNGDGLENLVRLLGLPKEPESIGHEFEFHKMLVTGISMVEAYNMINMKKLYTHLGLGILYQIRSRFHNMLTISYLDESSDPMLSYHLS